MALDLARLHAIDEPAKTKSEDAEVEAAELRPGPFRTRHSDDQTRTLPEFDIVVARLSDLAESVKVVLCLDRHMVRDVVPTIEQEEPVMSHRFAAFYPSCAPCFGASIDPMELVWNPLAKS